MSDLIKRQDAVDVVAKSKLMTAGAMLDCQREIKSLPSADRPTGEWIREELANMICNEICYYKEVTVDADSLNDLCEGCLIKKKKYGRPTGKWTDNHNGTFTCDQCGCKHSKSNYCPNCGAKMGVNK